ncbi:MAG: ATP-binding cassette domain-containing protein [Clostridia bacterium]|nr:ATP-binding cassette domain-containing protein [Clostridia bacterium]
MLKLKNISYSVKTENGKLQILDNICLSFEKGKTYAITGHNGSGKSTLAKIIMGIIKPTSGSVELDGQDITSLSPTKRAKLGIAFAFQQPVRFKGVTIGDMLSVASKDSATFDDHCNNLSAVGLCAREYINRELDASLSGGELKRIELALALARKTPVNIFDEPEAGIDLWSFDALIGIFKKLKDKNYTNIIVSHQEKLLKTADEIVVISGGKVEKQGNPSDILKTLSTSAISCNRLRGEQ